MRLPVTPARTLRAKRMSPGSPGRAHQLGAGAGTPSTARRGEMSSCSPPPLPLRPSPLPCPPAPPPLPVSVRSPQSPGSWGIGVSSGSGLVPGLTFQGTSGCGPAAPLGTQNSEDQRPQQGRWCRWASGVRVASCPGLTGRLCGPGQWLRPTEPLLPQGAGGNPSPGVCRAWGLGPGCKSGLGRFLASGPGPAAWPPCASAGPPLKCVQC